MSESIVVVGSSNTDMIIKAERIPKPGETIIGGEFSMAAGGKGANQAVSAARAGGQVTFIARLGDDMFGHEALKQFSSDGIDVEFVVVDGHSPSGVALIFVDEHGENSIAVASGANANVSPADVCEARNVIESADVLLMQLETPIQTISAAAGIADSNGVEVILNPAPAQPLSDDLLAQVSILTPNETETEILTGVPVNDEDSASKAADILLAKGVGIVLITLGARGVYAASEEFRGMIPAFTVDNPVDTTAAGDVFNGVLAVERARGNGLAEGIKVANAAAALSVMKLGAQASAPDRADIDAFLAE
ncbi:ribokinase [Candidatus Latescibacterota bacterium]